MKKVKEISNLTLPGLEPYQTLRRPETHIQQGIFVAEGEKVVRRLMESGLTIVSMLMTPEWFHELKPPYTGISVYVASKNLLESIVGFRLHQGIMAVAKVPEQEPWNDLMTRLQQPYLFVALDGLNHAENVGVVVRNCGAFGVQAILVGKTSSHPYLRRAVRNSMGAVFSLPVYSVEDLPQTLASLKDDHLTAIIGADPKGSQSIYESDLARNVCLVFGNEDTGISPEVLNVCSSQIAIPMSNSTDSINVASASAVFLNEIARQRNR